jgi:hypothetical protein
LKEHKNDASALQLLFNENRAEWPSEKFKEIFVEPTYLQKLVSMRPCILVGGRGTGKTTALQSLKYDSSLERLSSSGLGFGDLEYLGIHLRMNKNRVRAFSNGGIDINLWSKIFAHYFNLLACLELTKMTIWLEEITGQTLQSEFIDQILVEFDISEKIIKSEELKVRLQREISKLQVCVNNPSKLQEITLSIAESPLRVFAEALRNSGLAPNKIIFCCVDEYENLLDYQQGVINTYIKHAEPPLSYKLGVRKNGLRNRNTSDSSDMLRTPDDYSEIEIAEEGFEYFARAVAEKRLESAKLNGINIPTNLSDFLENLSFKDEALLLGAERVSKVVLSELREKNSELFETFKHKPHSETYFLQYWKEKENADILDLAHDWVDNEVSWKTRISNHGYASLFWLSHGNKGARIKKYYCGDKVFISLPAGNIRYFLELIDNAINYQLEEINYKLPSSEFRLSPKSQTLAARDVGKRRLDQLEGLADRGVQLKRLVLGIGKVFFEYARSPLGRTPETTSFIVSGESKDISSITELLNEGVGHLAFEVTPRTKATTNLELKDDEFRLHRIFSAFFEISHRKKRRITFNSKDLLGILDNKPAKAIASLLEGEEQADIEDLPEQLAFFSAFYNEAGK